MQIRSKWLLLVCGLIFVACLNTGKNSKTVEKKIFHDCETYKVSFVAVGDNLIHDAIYLAAYVNGIYDFKPFYADIKPLIKSHHLAFINQETMLGGVEIGLSSYPSFNSPVEVGEAIIDAGFNLISIANNHTLDRGEKAILNTIDYFESQDVIFSGAKKQADASGVKVFTQEGITFAFVAYTMLTNGQKHPQGKTYLANVYSREKVIADLSSLREQVDFILVSMHWGDEYVDEPTKVQKEEAEFLASLGVDVIIGHHPHVIQPVNIIDHEGKETIVIYSLGNFLSAQVGVDRKIGMAVSFDFIKTISKNNEIKLAIDNLSSHLLYHYRDQNQYHVTQLRDIDALILPDYETHFERKVMLIKKYGVEIDVK